VRFVAGVLVGESPILTRQIDERLRGLITSLFMPVFFGLAGLTAEPDRAEGPQSAAAHRRADLDRLGGKFGGAFLGGSLGGLSRPESWRSPAA